MCFIGVREEEIICLWHHKNDGVGAEHAVGGLIYTCGVAFKKMFCMLYSVHRVISGAPLTVREELSVGMMESLLILTRRKRCGRTVQQ